jgi:hypothetical protein
VVLLGASANTVALLAEAVRRVIRQSYEKLMNVPSEVTRQKDWQLRAFTPYRNVEDWQTLALYTLYNTIAATIALYLANRFMPSLVTNSNSLLNKVVPIQFTPSHIPLTKFVGL